MTHLLKKEIFLTPEYKYTPNYEYTEYIRKKRNSPISNNLTPEKEFVNNISRFLIDNNYNCYTLKNYNFSELEEKILIETSIEMVNNPEKYNNRNYNYQMALCVYNYFKKKPFILKENQLLSGVGKVYRLDGMDKIIYLFSDTDHDTVNGCPAYKKTINFRTFLYELSQSIPLFLDIFIEISNIKVYIKDNNTLSDIVMLRSYEYRDRFPENVRYHYIDNRTILKNSKFISYVEYFFRNQLKQKSKESVEEYKNRILKLTYEAENEHLRVLEISSDYNLFKQFIGRLINLNKNIQKQFNKLDNLLGDKLYELNMYEYIKNIIIELCWETKYKVDLTDPKDKYIKLRNKIYNNFEEFKIDFTNLLDILYKNCVKITLPIMDMYFIGRLFKIFDTSKNVYDPIRAKYCIVYAGDLHIQIYKQLLERIGFRTTETQKELSDGYFKCVDMKDINQPLFTYKRNRNRNIDRKWD